ncbi:MAG TPA: ATP-binding protein [Paracoccaceae bacterium]|nr:ATP-binding protein [Paracoccaceae bacterium]
MDDPAASAFLEAVPLPALIIEQGLRIEAVNRLAGEVLEGALAGRHLATVIRAPEVLDAAEAALRDEAPRECEFDLSEGRRLRTFSATARSLGSGKGILLVLQDRTEAFEIGRMRTDFVANVSHELRTPLTAMSGIVETLKGAAGDDPAAQARFLDIIGEEVARMNRLVSDLLSLARVESGHMAERAPADIGKLVAQSVELLAGKAADLGVSIQLSAPEAPVMALVDQDLLRHVFNNLIENAVKYGRSGGKVDIAIEEIDDAKPLKGRAVAIRVRDYGEGIEPRHLPRLTERFYRIDRHRSRGMGGTGLGLAIVKHAIERHRGRLLVESTPGKGSTFTALLPFS